MKHTTNKNEKWFTSAKKFAVAVAALAVMVGCSKKNSNTNPYMYYGNAYCGYSAGCYNQSGYGNTAYGQMFASGLGKINTTDLQAEVALNFYASAGVSGFAMNSYAGNTNIVGVLNVYGSSYGCPVPPGQYQLVGTANFSSMSFVGEIQTTNGSIRIQLPNNFITPMQTQSVMGPSFPFAVQNDVLVTIPYGSCGDFVMY